jgi:hypothetical protein
VPSLVKIGSVVLEKKSKMLKFTDRQTDEQTDGTTDGRQTTGDQKSSFELSAQMSKKWSLDDVKNFIRVISCAEKEGKTEDSVVHDFYP